MDRQQSINHRLYGIDKQLAELDVERARLLDERKNILEAHNRQPVLEEFTPDQKIQLFGSLFRGRTDLFACRWENQSGRSGYSVACHNEWKRGVCNKPRVKCSECRHRSNIPMDKSVIHGHLTGKVTAGVYPLLHGDLCWFLAADFDKSDWKDSVAAYREACTDAGIDCAVEISRSGNGAHAWIFFDAPVAAIQARSLGFALMDKAMERYPKLGFDSYDRLFPNQDTMPAGGFGNLIALPLQYEPRARGSSLFVDYDFTPLADQWSYLSDLKRLPAAELGQRVVNLGYTVQQPSALELEGEQPWENNLPISECLISGCPAQITLVVANQVFIPISALPSQLVARLKRLATFSNPVFFKTQALRFSTQGTPRHICCARIEKDYLCLPRGCRDEAEQMLQKQGIEVLFQDHRCSGEKLSGITFQGELRADQRRAVKAILQNDTGILHAPTAFGKTVTAIEVITKRQVNTLILVHSKELVTQWQERLQSFIHGAKIGVIYGGKRKPSGDIDVATYQSLLNKNDNTVRPEVFCYGQVIVDECHHLSAPRYQMLLSEIKPKYVLGLTATPQRQDGHQPIIFMQAGPLRHKAAPPKEQCFSQQVVCCRLDDRPPKELLNPDVRPHIADLFRWLVDNPDRNRRIINDVLSAIKDDRHILILTERRAHAEILTQLLKERDVTAAVLTGGMKAKQKRDSKALLSKAKVVIATGKYVGEGFDLPRLDTLYLALPISWKGTLAQYAGRIHRTVQGKTMVRIYDYIDTGHPMLERMFYRRSKAYRAMGYDLIDSAERSRQYALI
ncbi:MAG: DEAD/DEAH box helicase family protein [Motiliproteus sp.]